MAMLQKIVATRKYVLLRRTLSSLSNDAIAPTAIQSLRPQHQHHRAHLVFGANTDVGKSIVSAGLVRAAAAAAVAYSSPPHRPSVNYIKPLQCGGSDESFVSRHLPSDSRATAQCWDSDGGLSDYHGPVNCETLFSWETPTSPHLASRLENLPVSDNELIFSVLSSLEKIEDKAEMKSPARESGGSGDGARTRTRSFTIIESAGGVLSPSASSPLNRKEAKGIWGWSTQADLYAPLGIPVIFIGDGKLGGISVTLASLEALWSRGYKVNAVIFIAGSVVESDDSDMNDDEFGIQFGEGNAEALREYVRANHNQETCKDDRDSKKRGLIALQPDSVICLPSLPPMPSPLENWYEKNKEAFAKLYDMLCK